MARSQETGIIGKLLCMGDWGGGRGEERAPEITETGNVVALGLSQLYEALEG